MEPSSISARPDVTVATTQPRVTPTPARGAFKQVLAQSLVRGAETAMKVLPGGPLMAVAVRGAGGGAASLGIPLGGVGAAPTRGAPEGPGGAGLRSNGVANAAISATGVGGGGAAAPGVAGGEAGIESSLQQSQEMNLYYLQIQEAVNAQNRTFSTLSNVLKAEHDTVKTAIGNIR
ncbi:MAG TPA: hypothetical protein VLT33_18010 [Labilithrix sp.]|nr:hypothetical protein [Labilithrix sp.]